MTSDAAIPITPQRRQGGEIAGIAQLRGLAAVMVCWYHFTNGNNDFISEASWIKAIAGKGWLGVEIFFVITGFIIPYSMTLNNYRWPDLPRFLAKRWVRLGPPFWLSIVLVLGLNALANHWWIPRAAVSSVDVVLNAGYLIPFFPPHRWLSGQYWTLGVEVQYYAVVALLFPLIVGRSRHYFWVTAVALMFLSVNSSQPAFAVDYAMFFILGFALCRRFLGQMQSREFHVFSLLVFCLIYYKFSLQYLLAGLIPWLLIAFRPDLNLRGLRWLGTISYSLYLIHLAVGKNFIPLAARHIDGDTNRLIFVCILFCLTLWLARGYYLLIERPAIRWSQRVQYGRRRAQEAA